MKEGNPESIGDKSAGNWKRILVPTDLSERSRSAVRAATYLAEQCGAKVTLLHVVQLYSGSLETGMAADHFMNLARESLDKIADDIPPALMGEKLVALGPEGTFQKIIETAHELSSDLIVVATHSYGPIRRALLGSLAISVIRHAPCAVLVVSPDSLQMKHSII